MSGTHKNNLELLLGILAVAFMWAMFWVCITMGLSNANSGRPNVVVFVLLNAFGQIVCIAASSLFLKRSSTVTESLAAVVALSIASIVVLEIAYVSGFQNPGVSALTGLLFGVVSGLMWVNAALFLARRNSDETALCLSVGSLIGSLLLICSLLFIPQAGEIFTLAFVPASLLLFYYSHNAQSEEVRASHEVNMGKPNDLRRLFDNVREYSGLYLVLLAFGLVFGMQIGMSFNESGVSQLAVGMSFIIPGLFLLVTYYGLKRTINLRTLCLAILMLTVAILLPEFPNDGLALTLKILLMYASFTLFDLSSMATLAEIGKKSTFPCSVSILLGRFLVMIAVLAGTGVSLLVRSEPAVIPLVNSIAILLLIFVFSRFTIMREKLSSEVRIPKDSPKQEAIKIISEKYSLTKREAEIFQLVIKGYNTKRIGEEMFISGNTVKSHLYRIYAKLDIHSQQEIIKFVEDQARDISSNIRDGLVDV